MLTEKQMIEIREHLDKAQNPLFFFDNDNDGLTSFLLLQRFIGRGRGVAVKGAHSLGKGYFRRIKELNPDYVFILDIPTVDDEFLKKVDEANLPIVWIDHHPGDKPEGNFDYYNPYHNDKTMEPVCYLSYKITGRKEDMWVSMIGCISDYYMPDFYDEFTEKYPELSKKNPINPFDMLYNSEIGKIAQILDFGLKDTTTNVVNMMKFMMKVKGPLDILEENSKTKSLHDRYAEINTKYQKILKKARQEIGTKLIFFQYSGDMSLSSNLANQLKFEYPDKFLVVAYLGNDLANLSIRGENARKITLESIKDIPGALGGGHDKATGAKINIDYLPEIKKNVERLVEKYN